MISNEFSENSSRNIYNNTNQQLLDKEEVLSESSALLDTSEMERQQPSQSFDVSSHSEAYDIGTASQQQRTSPVESFGRAPSADMRPALSMESNSQPGPKVSLPQEQQEEQQRPENIVQIASEPQIRTQPSSSLPLDLQNTLSSTDETDYPTINSTLNRPIQSIRSARSQTPHRDRTIYQQDGQRLQRYYNEQANRIFSEDNARDEENAQPFVEVSNQVLNVRKNALSVYNPLTYTWVSFALGTRVSIMIKISTSNCSFFIAHFLSGHKYYALFGNGKMDRTVTEFFHYSYSPSMFLVTSSSTIFAHILHQKFDQLYCQS